MCSTLWSALLREMQKMRKSIESFDGARQVPIKNGSIAIVTSSVKIMIEKVYIWNPVSQQPEKDGKRKS